MYMKSWEMQRRRRRKSFEMGISQFINLRQHRTIAEASAVESPIRQETIGFPAHFFARAHNFKPGRANLRITLDTTLWHEVKQLIAVQHLVNTVLHEKQGHEKEPLQRLPDRR